MAMASVKGIDLPSGQPVSLNPAGLHVWLAGLKQPLKAGQSFPLTLRFEKAGERRVSVPVIEPAAPPPGG
jgi:copper(I)-binding protein